MIHQRMEFTRFWKVSPVAILPLAAVLAFACAVRANANSAKPRPTDVPARVIAHLLLDSPAGNQMVLQNEGDKHYLYIQKASKQGYTIVDVTKPEFPGLVSPKSSSKDATAGNLEIVGSNLAVAEVPDSKKPAVRSAPVATSTVRILDVSDPEHPTTLQTFNNVTSMVGDAGRGIIYLANDQGLWVLRHNRQLLAPAKSKRPCNSEDAVAAMPPDCE